MIEEACWALGIMLNMETDDGKNRAVQAGAIQVTLAAMRRHERSANVQQYACKLLQVVTANNAREEEYKEKAASAGAVEALVAALRAHSLFFLVRARH